MTTRTSETVTLTGVLLAKNHPIFGQLVSILVILVLMALLIKLKPFKEQLEDATKWSSTNNMAAVATACQAVGMVCGLGSKVLADNGSTTDLSDGLISFSQVVVLMLPPTMTVVAEVQRIVELKEAVAVEKRRQDESDLVEVIDSPVRQDGL